MLDHTLNARAAYKESSSSGSINEARPMAKYETQTRNAFVALDAQQDRTDELIKELTQRLKPVLAVSPAKDTGAESLTQDPHLSPMALNAFQMAERLRIQNYHLRELLDDLSI